MGMVKATIPSTEITWSPRERLARVRYGSGITLRGEDGDFLTDSLRGWIGSDRRPFAVFADAAGLRASDAEYRAKASSFFRAHRDVAFIAIVNVGPLVHVMIELFRVGTGVQLKTFPRESEARAWLRTKGIAT